MSVDKKICYLCDPNKNKECRKTSCQKRCFCTQKEEYAMLDENGKPIVKYVTDFPKQKLQQIL